MTDHRIRTAGAACVAAGVLGAASGIYLAVVEPAVADDRWSYPLTSTGFAAIQVFFVVQHLGLLAGLLALRWSGAYGEGRAGRIGHLLSVGGMAGLTVTEGVAIAAADHDLDTGLVAALNAAYGVTTTALGVGLVAGGIAVARAGVWNGHDRWLTLVMGVWVWVPMFPALAVSFLGARLSIAAWMVLFAALGWALVARHAEVARIATPVGSPG